MTNHQRRQSAHYNAELTAVIPAATPPCRPAPMPQQTLVCWTPRMILATMLARLRERRAQATAQRTSVYVTIDEPR
jgi:hypothetical protein